MTLKRFLLKTVRVTFYYFDDTVRWEDFDIDNILIEGKSHENILIYDISVETLIDLQFLCIIFNKIDGFIRIYDGNKYLILIGSEKNEAIYNRIRCLISLKSDITYICSHYFSKIKVASHDSLPIEKILTFHNVIIHIKSVVNEDENHYYYKIILDKC